ncbi:MAG: ABC transporter permease [Candidatus Dormiibacterota bacterium]
MRYVAKRLGLFLVTLWAALTVNFVLPRLMPGNEAEAVFAQLRGAPPQALKALDVEFGVNVHQNVLLTYFQYLGNCFTGQFGLTVTREPVMHTILQNLPWTLGLVGVATVVSFAMGTLLGVVAAWRRGGRIDSFLPPLLFVATAFPVFFLGLLLLFVLGVTLGWFPTAGNMSIGATPALSLDFIGDVLSHAVLPAITLVLSLAGTWTYTMRNNMVTTLAEDYVKMARAKGLAPWRIMLDYSARNAILPNLTGFAMQMGYVLGGAILVEYTFNYPGVGYLFFTATENHDLPLMEALFLLFTMAVLICVLLADFATAALDPRTREA